MTIVKRINYVHLLK